MRIVIVATAGESLIKFRGHLIKEWIKRGHEVWCISIETKEEMESSINELGATYYQVAGNRTGTSFFDSFRMLREYKKAFKYIKPDICFLYMSKPIAFGGVAAIKQRIGRIYIFQTGLEIAFYSKGFKNLILRKLLKALYRFVHYHCDTVFFMCKEDIVKMLKWKLVNSKQVCYVDGSGVDMNYFTKQELPSKPVVLMVARLVWSKGIREYVEAAKIVKTHHPEVRFLLAGGLDENSEALTEDELKQLQDDNIIEYLGYRKDVRSALRECSIFTLPSYHEGKGTAILEAQAVGRPIITTTAPGCSETVIDGYNGYLVPSKDSLALADKILFLVEHPEIRKQMAENAYEHCKKTFDSNIISNVICNRMGL